MFEIQCPDNACSSQEIYQNYPDHQRHFTTDWFDYNKDLWKVFSNELKDQPQKSCLEVGAFQGRSTVFIADEMCNAAGSRTDVIDTWEGSIENTETTKHLLWETFNTNLRPNIEYGKVRVHRGYSQDKLIDLTQNVRNGTQTRYDFIYIDGSHHAADVLRDAVLSWDLLKPGGFMAFDDYTWTVMPTEQERPQIAIDGFLNVWEGKYDIIHKGYQLHIRKLAD